jgi:hypothetical protein
VSDVGKRQVKDEEDESRAGGERMKVKEAIQEICRNEDRSFLKEHKIFMSRPCKTVL